MEDRYPLLRAVLALAKAPSREAFAEKFPIVAKILHRQESVEVVPVEPPRVFQVDKTSFMEPRAFAMWLDQRGMLAESVSAQWKAMHPQRSCKVTAPPARVRENKPDPEPPQANAGGEPAREEAPVENKPDPESTDANAGGKPARAAPPSEQLSIWVGNVDIGVTVDQLKAHFEPCGAIKRCTIPTDRTTNKPKEFAYVEFEEQGGDEAVENALKLSGSELGGRRIRVNRKRAYGGKGRGQ